MTEEQKEKIRKEAKLLLDNFAKTIDKVKVSKKTKASVAGGFREERNSIKNDEKFRSIMFANAPNIEGDNIIAEKKSW